MSTPPTRACWATGSGRCWSRLIRSSLELALAYHCETVAFPLISSGVYGYPKEQALQVVVETIGDFLRDHEMTVYLVLFDQASCAIGSRLFAGRYTPEQTDGGE